VHAGTVVLFGYAQVVEVQCVLGMCITTNVTLGAIGAGCLQLAIAVFVLLPAWQVIVKVITEKHHDVGEL
jgi:hypothetical protein